MPKHSGRWCYVSLQDHFDWESYLNETGAKPAPNACFRQSEEPPDNKFEEGMKLCAIDPRNQNSWCIATVISTQGPRLQLRLDGVDSMNDFWKLVDSDDIKPISWGKRMKHLIVPPLGFLPRMNLWPQYLSGRLESSEAAPDEYFIPSPPKAQEKFQVGQKLEAVDPKNPSIVCVASVSQVTSERIRVDFDGWRASYFFTVNSRDIFPVGWCAKAGIALQEPGPQATQALKQQPAEKQSSQRSGRSRASLQPSQPTHSPEVRKRRKSSDSSSIASHSIHETVRKSARTKPQINGKIETTTTFSESEDDMGSSRLIIDETGNGSDMEPKPEKKTAKVSATQIPLEDEKLLLYVNSSCNSGPHLDGKALAKHVKKSSFNSSIWPSMIVKNVIAAILNTSTTGSDKLIPMIDEALSEAHCPVIEELARSSRNSLSLDDVSKVMAILATRLQYCPNLFSQVKLNQPCELCQKSGSMVEAPFHGENSKHSNGSHGLLIASDNHSHKSSPAPSSGRRRQASRATSVADSPPQPMTETIQKMMLSSNLSTSSISEWSIEDVGNFLSSSPDKSLSMCASMFKDNEIDGEALLLLNSESLINHMKLKLGPSLKLAHLIERLRVTHAKMARK